MLNKQSTIEEWFEAVHECHQRHEREMAQEVREVVRAFNKHYKCLMKDEYRTNHLMMITNIVFDTIKMSDGNSNLIDNGKEVINFYLS
jgi:DNA-binding protein H-NS